MDADSTPELKGWADQSETDSLNAMRSIEPSTEKVAVRLTSPYTKGKITQCSKEGLLRLKCGCS
jgi:hypothetical protein